MSTLIMAACWPLQMSPAQKSVLVSLADNANDEGVCWPSIAKIGMRTCLSERAVQNAIKWLSSVGLVTVHERAGRSSYFTITPAAYAPPQEQHPAAGAPPPPQQVRTTPAAGAPRTVIEPSIEPPKSKQQRGTRLGADWVLPEEWKAWALQERSDWDEAQVKFVADTFRDFWISKSGANAIKLDWQATWRNWVRNEKRGYFNGGKGGKAATRQAPRQDFNNTEYEGSPDEQFADFTQ